MCWCSRPEIKSLPQTCGKLLISGRLMSLLLARSHVEPVSFFPRWATPCRGHLVRRQLQLCHPLLAAAHGLSWRVPIVRWSEKCCGRRRNTEITAGDLEQQRYGQKRYCQKRYCQPTRSFLVKQVLMQNPGKASLMLFGTPLQETTTNHQTPKPSYFKSFGDKYEARQILSFKTPEFWISTTLKPFEMMLRILHN